MKKTLKVFLNDVDYDATTFGVKVLLITTSSFTLLGNYVYRVGKGILDNITRFQTFRLALAEVTHEDSKEITC